MTSESIYTKLKSKLNMQINPKLVKMSQ